MVKTFKRCYQTIFGTQHTHDIIEVETDGLVTDWYPKLWSICHTWIIKHDYGTNDYITQMVVWDNDTSVYQYSDITDNHLMTTGAYIKYIRNTQFPQGFWFGQYPYNAWRCNGLFNDDIKTVCDNIRNDVEYHRIRHDGLGDILSATLFPDHVIDVDQDVNAAIVPQKKQAIKAIDDAIQAFEILNTLDLSGLYGNVPDKYIECTQHLINRLANARMWVESSTVKIDHV